jgi:hypothetical protein
VKPIAVEVILGLAFAYVGVGAVFALSFVTFGAGRMDPDARGAPITVRLLLLPGALALWPLLLRKWLKGNRS